MPVRMRARTHPGKRAWTCDARGQVLNTKSGHMSPCSYYCTHTDYNISLRIQRHQKAACFLPSIDNSGVKQLVHPTPRPPPCLLLHHPRPTYPLSRVSLPQTFNSCRTLPHPPNPHPCSTHARGHVVSSTPSHRHRYHTSHSRLVARLARLPSSLSLLSFPLSLSWLGVDGRASFFISPPLPCSASLPPPQPITHLLSIHPTPSTPPYPTPNPPCVSFFRSPTRTLHPKDNNCQEFIKSRRRPFWAKLEALSKKTFHARPHRLAIRTVLFSSPRRHRSTHCQTVRTFGTCPTTSSRTWML